VINLKYNYETGVVKSDDTGSFVTKVLQTASDKVVPVHMGGPGKLNVVLKHLAMKGVTQWFS
jgi:hypothetical protein